MPFVVDDGRSRRVRQVASALRLAGGRDQGTGIGGRQDTRRCGVIPRDLCVQSPVAAVRAASSHVDGDLYTTQVGGGLRRHSPVERIGRVDTGVTARASDDVVREVDLRQPVAQLLELLLREIGGLCARFGLAEADQTDGLQLRNRDQADEDQHERDQRLDQGETRRRRDSKDA